MTKTVKFKSLALVGGMMAILLQLYMLICGCSSPPPQSHLTSNPNKRLYSAKCGSCHRLLPPQDYSAETWVHYVDKYGKQMTDQEKQQVLNYLKSNAAPDQ